MDEEEVAAFLGSSKTAVLTTLGRGGWPHSVAMWFVPPGVRGEQAIRMWTYRKSQKAKNLGRDPRGALLTESGESYADLRGVLVRARMQVIDDFDEVRAIGIALHRRYAGPFGDGSGGAEIGAAALAEIERQARKRVGIVVPLDRVASWDHRKLGSG